jgi:putative chitinase
MQITNEQLRKIMPQLSADKLGQYLPYLNAAMEEFAINTPLRQSAFLAQLAHESAELTVWVENLNYSAKGLVATWPKRFTLAKAQLYHRQPENIANHVYANRMGNGDEASGDGWKYRGHCPLQITGKDMHRKAGDHLGIDLVTNPDLLLLPEYGFRGAAWCYAVEKGLNQFADRGDIREITRRINGGYTGLEERVKYYGRAKQVLGVN